MKGRVAIAILLSAVVSAAAWGQEGETQTMPVPATTQDQMPVPEASSGVVLVPDNRPLSGAQEGGLGVPARVHSNVVFGIAASETVNSNSQYVPGSQNNYEGGANVAGNVQLSHYWRRGQLFYQGVGRYNSQRDEAYHTERVVVSEKFVGRRASLLLSDQFGYTPAADFGAAGMEGLLGMSGNGINGLGSLSASASSAGIGTLNSSYVPNQSILTVPSGRINNTTVGEVDYRLSARHSMTFTGSYGLLHSVEDSDLLDTRQYNASFGYNYLASPRTSLAWTYGFSRMDFPGLDRAVNSHTVSMVYGRTLVGKLYFSGDIGGQFYSIDDPLVSQHDITWSSRAGLKYAIGRTSLSSEWMRSVTGGSGVLPGAETNSVTVRAERQIAAAWNVLATGGYAHNAGLGSQQDLETEYVGAGVNRRIGRYLGVYFNYNFQHQKGSGACTAQGCGIPFQQHVFAFGFNWTSRPYGIF